jgi:ABC-2 type transport system permease protein
MKLLGQLPDLLQAPLSSFEISMAYIIGGTIRGTVNGLLILLVGITLGGISVIQPFATVGFIILVSVAFSSIGFLLGQLADTWDQLATLQNFLLTPLSFLGGIFYSIKMLPDWAQSASFYNPIYYMINGLRFTILGVSDSPPMTSFIVAFIMTVGFFLAAVLMMESGKKIKL